MVNVTIVSDDGWSWALGWGQLGKRKLFCESLTSVSDSNLDELREALSGTLELITDYSGDTFDNRKVVCLHVGSNLSSVMHDCLSLLPRSVCVLGTAHLASLGNVKDLLGPDLHYEELRHQRLGGLTCARISVFWRGGSTMDSSSVRPGKILNPSRPLATFLEPSVRLVEWRHAGKEKHDESIGCWCPHPPAGKPCPWPFGSAPLWVNATSVCLGKGAHVERPLTTKERSQLLDLREDWGDALVKPMWRWDEGATPPLRFIVEFVLSANQWLPASGALAGQLDTRWNENTQLEIDWGRTRPPLPDLPVSGCPSGTLERMTYFGWTWESTDTLATSKATRADDADVDLSLWNVGGDGPGMEESRTGIRTGLHSSWRRRITMEAARWCRTNPDVADAKQQRHDLEALRDCVIRCSDSTWWKWDGGSCLLFWRWPPAGPPLGVGKLAMGRKDTIMAHHPSD